MTLLSCGTYISNVAETIGKLPAKENDTKKTKKKITNNKIQ